MQKKKIIFYLSIIIIFVCLYISYKKTEYFTNIPTFHILIATGGRPSLKNMLDSLKDELTEADAITVVFDGPDAKPKSRFDDSWLQGHAAKINLIEQNPNLGFWGHPIRNKYQGILQPKTTFIMNADDDDTYIKGSFEILRAKCTDPATLYISKMRYSANMNQILPVPGTTTFSMGNIGTPNGIIPFDNANKSIFTNIIGGDYEYYRDLANNVDKVVFMDEVIYLVR